jgi:para-aminobenzoate synthetase component 1
VSGWAYLAGRWAQDPVDVTHDPADLARPGFWAVAITFEGAFTAIRFAQADARPLPVEPWVGPPAGAWTSTLDRADYLAAVESIRARIAAGDVYQANLCRMLSAPWPGGSLLGLAGRLARSHSAPYAGAISVPEAGCEMVSASPELYLRWQGEWLNSGPIKGTGRTRADLSDKDVAENVMIVDLVRNDLGRVCRPGTVAVPVLLEVEEHPGLVHLVSQVSGRLLPGVGWPQILAATFPPGSVSGAPKLAALQIIDELEPVARGPYCGAVGWVEDGRAELAVAIRSFFVAEGRLWFGTGAGITWASHAEQEWRETELKAERLIALASREAS